MAKKQKSIKKVTRTNKGKVGLKKLDFKKNWKKLSFLGLVGILLVSGMSIGIYNRFFNDEASAAATYLDICVAGPNSSCNPATIYYCKRALPGGSYYVYGHVSNRSSVPIINPSGSFLYPGGTVRTTFSGTIPVKQSSVRKTFYSPGLPSVPGRIIANC